MLLSDLVATSRPASDLFPSRIIYGQHSDIFSPKSRISLPSVPGLCSVDLECANAERSLAPVAVLARLTRIYRKCGKEGKLVQLGCAASV